MANISIFTPIRLSQKQLNNRLKFIQQNVGYTISAVPVITQDAPGIIWSGNGTQDNPLQVNVGNSFSAELDFPDTSPQKSSDIQIEATGAVEGDAVVLGISEIVNIGNTCFTAWVASADKVTIRFNNYSTDTIDPNPAIFKVTVLKF